MTRLYIVAYDFKNPSPATLEPFYEELKRFRAWWHFIEGTWIIRTDQDARGIYSRLRPLIDENVNLLITEMGKDCSGYLPSKAWEWIENNRDPSFVGSKEAS